MSDLVEELRKELISSIDNDEIILPTLPEVALRVREAAEDPSVGIDQMSKVIGNDTALTARIIKVVNSPLLRSNKEISNLKMAVARLGINYTCNLAIGLAMEQMFQATNALVDSKMREVWNKSTEIAGISCMLCRRYTRLMPDQATLAGLLHQIGILPILTFAEESNELLDDPSSLNHLIEQLHPVIGERILQSWEFPQTIACVPGQYLNFQREPAEVDYADIIQVATLLSHTGSSHPFDQLDWQQIPAFERLGLNADRDLHSDEDLSAAMSDAMEMLKASS